MLYVGVDNFKLKRIPIAAGHADAPRSTSDLADTMRAGVLEQLKNAPADVVDEIKRVTL